MSNPQLIRHINDLKIENRELTQALADCESRNDALEAGHDKLREQITKLDPNR